MQVLITLFTLHCPLDITLFTLHCPLVQELKKVHGLLQANNASCNEYCRNSTGDPIVSPRDPKLYIYISTENYIVLLVLLVVRVLYIYIYMNRSTTIYRSEYYCIYYTSSSLVLRTRIRIQNRTSRLGVLF